jgi:inosine/xanthosine triphosphate pyrophosphatase family protein
MLTLVTSNPAKYQPFQRELENMRLALERPKRELPELQSVRFSDALEAKARSMAEMFQRPVLIDDAGLVLEAYDPFPGPLTSVVLRSLGRTGLGRLLHGVSDRGRMECHIGCWVQGNLRQWTGTVDGRVDTTRQPRDNRMILTDLFLPDGLPSMDPLIHRARALAALKLDVFKLHLDLASSPAESGCDLTSPGRCPFCSELEEDGPSIFSEMIGDRLRSRILYRDEDFVVMPPIGQFMRGGLLLLARRHIPSFAWLSPDRFPRLEQLIKVIGDVLVTRWGVAPLVFEHGPAPERSKGTCCVDHAHFNIFPAPVLVHPHLAERMHFQVAALADLRQLQSAEFGYLFVQENDGTRRAYDGQYAPSQLVRRFVTSQLGMPARWHWRDFPGIDELVDTYRALDGQIHL